MDNIRGVLICSIAPIAAYFHPIQNVLSALLVLFTLNFIFGLLAGIIVNKETFQIKKAFMCGVEACVFFVIMASVFYVGDHIENKDGALQCITAITYTLIYFYSVNIFKNLKHLFPKSRAIAFIYFVISIEFVAKIPHLEKFLKQEATT